MRRVFFLLSVLLLGMWGGMGVVHAQGPDDAESVVARVYFGSKTQLNQLASRLDIWEVNNTDGYFVTRLTPRAQQELQAMGMKVVLQQSLSYHLYLGLQWLPGQTTGIPNYACYRTVDETYRDLAALAAAHPQLATWIDVGDSWEKVTSGGSAGDDLNVLVLTNRNIPGPKPKFFLIAAIHAREYSTAELATRFAEQLVNDYGVDPDATWLLDYYELHLLPQANPDGRRRAEAGESWRKNTDDDDGCTVDHVDWGYYSGTDLNRNSSFKWNHGGASGDACSEVYHGPTAASEPEVQAIETYARSIFPDQRGPDDADAAPADASGVFITLHSYSQLVLFPWEWSDAQAAPNFRQLQTLGRKFGFFNHYQVCSDCLYNASGTTDDFVYGELGVASYTFELGTEFFQDCRTFEEDIIPRNMPALRYAFKAARRPYQDPLGPEAVAVTVAGPVTAASTTVTLTATIDDGRYASGGYGEEPVQTIAAARYSIDAPSWQGADTFAMRPVDGVFDSPSEAVIAAIDPHTLAPGRHLIFVEGQDADGHWGVPSAAFITLPAAPSSQYRQPLR